MSVFVWVCLCSLCLSVREDISGTTRAIFTIFVHIPYVRRSVLRRVDDRPHRLSARTGWRECTARAKCNRRLPDFAFVCSCVYKIYSEAVLLLTSRQPTFCNRLATACAECYHKHVSVVVSMRLVFVITQVVVSYVILTSRLWKQF